MEEVQKQELYKKWEAAIERWNVAQRNSAHPYKNGFQLAEDQIAMKLALEKDIHALDEEEVLLIADSSGMLLSGKTHRATVDSSLGSNTVAISGDGLVGYVTKFFQIYSINPKWKLSKKQKEEEFFRSLLQRVNTNKKYELNTILQRKEETKGKIRTYERDLKANKERLKEIETLLAGTPETKDATKNSFITELNSLKKNKRIANAYLDNKGDLIVETTMLHPVRRATGKETEDEIGRFAMRLSINGVDDSEFHNLDYQADSDEWSEIEHPTISCGKMCTGDNFNIIDNLLETGRFFEAVDFICIFLTLWPHDTGSPYITHAKWLKEKYSVNESNPFKRDEKIWELYPPKKKTAVEEKKEKVTQAPPIIAETNEANNHTVRIDRNTDLAMNTEGEMINVPTINNLTQLVNDLEIDAGRAILGGTFRVERGEGE